MSAVWKTIRSDIIGIAKTEIVIFSFQQDTVISEEDEAIINASSSAEAFRTTANLIDSPQSTSTSGRSRPETKASKQRADSFDDFGDPFWQARSPGKQETGLPLVNGKFTKGK